MSFEGGTKPCRQLSVYGETVKAFKAYMEAPHGKTVFIPYGDDKSQKRNLLEIFELMKEGELSFNDLEYLYSMVIETVCAAVRKAFASHKQNLSWIYFKSFLFTQLPRIIDEAESRIKSMRHASSSVFLIYERIRRLHALHPGFVRKIIDAAVDDAPVRLEMEATLSAVNGVMDCSDVPMTGCEEIDMGIDLDGEAQYDA